MPNAQAPRIECPGRQQEKEHLLIRELSISSLLAAVLVSRGIDTPELAHEYLYPSLDSLGDPKLLPDYQGAVDEILGAKERGDLIFIHGDYDVDGVTSTSIFQRFLKIIGCNVHAHVPHRMKEGYGIHHSAVVKAHEAGAKLLLTCDCGISAHDRIEAAIEMGMKVVVTDHHEVGEELPKAQAVINPHRLDSKYPYQHLCGAGVVFRLCEGIAHQLNMPVDKYRKNFIDLAVLGTVADCMPLDGENRAIVKCGLPFLTETQKKGLQALIEVSGLKDVGQITSRHVGFQLGPRLNATGRIDDSSHALQLLLSKDIEESYQLAQMIDSINTERRERQNLLIAQALDSLKDKDLSDVYAIVIASEEWHPGIIGLAASRLVETYHRPSYVMSVDPSADLIKGSARSIPGFSVGDSIRALSHILSGGGHAAAAGFSSKVERLGEIIEGLEAYAASHLTKEDLIPQIEVDAEIRPEESSLSIAKSLDMLEPTGIANRSPVFVARNVRFSQISEVKNNTYKFRLTHGKNNINAVKFRLLERPEWLVPNLEADVSLQLSVNSYKGNEKVEWTVREIAPLN